MRMNRIALLAVMVVALGGYTLGPAVAAKFNKKTASKIFLKKKAAKKQYLKKKAANKTFLKKADANGFDQAAADELYAAKGESYTKPEADERFEPAAKQVEVSIPPSAWESDEGNSFMNVARTSTGTSIVSPNVAADQVYFADVPLALSGPASVEAVEVCLETGLDTSVDMLTLRKRHPSAADPNPAPTDSSSAISVGTDSSTCQVHEPDGVSLDPGDVATVKLNADFVDTGSSLTIRSATLVLAT